jgi:PAS domain S-box-containing protein
MKPANFSILLIEDNPGDARLVKENLALVKERAFRLEWVSDLRAGLAYLAENLPDAILLDLGLPDSNGLATFGKVRDRMPKVPIVLLTGLDDEVLASKAVQSGAQDYLVKGHLDSRLLSRTILYAIERERAQESLRNSEKQLFNAAIIARLGPWEYDVEKDLFTFNDPFFAVFGTTAAAVGGYTMTSAEYARRFVHPEDRDLVGVETRKAVETDDPNFNRQLEHRMIKADGTAGFLSVRFFIVKDAKGKTVKTFGVNQDITEHRRAEIKLKESEIRYRVLFEGSSYGILATDVETKRFLDANPSICRMLGYSADELMQLGIPDIHPKEALASIMADVKTMAEEGPSTSFAAPCLRKDGAVFYADISGASTIIHGRKCLVGFFVDVTARQQAEKELANSHEQLRALTGYWQNAFESERTRIARQLHDEFGQSLTALKMDLTWLTKRIPRNDEKVERLRGMNALVDDNIVLMRQIATDLRPNLLDDLGLNAALEWQTEEYSRRSDLAIDLDMPKGDLALPPAVNTALFRIYQEAVTNVTRHAQATHVNASLQLTGQTLILTVQDNGNGISDGELKAPFSLGLLGMRERAAQCGGELTICGVKGKGTTLTVRIPLPPSAVNGVK